MLISIVVPVYNVEKYIKRCLNSLVNQTYKRIQVILVDDGSTDSSGKICDEYAHKYDCFHVVHKENGGLSSARNTGMEFCEGKYITFLDSDDWFSEDYVEKCVVELEKNAPELLITPYIREYSKRSIHNDIFSKSMILFDSKNVRSQLLARLFGPNDDELNPVRVDDLSPAWGKFYLASKCKQIKFVDTKIIGTEDAWFNINFISKIKNAEYFGKAYYHYNKENNTSLIRTFNPYLYSRWCTLYKKMKQFIQDNKLGEQYLRRLDNRIVCNLLGLSDNIFNSNLSFCQKYKYEKKLLNHTMYSKKFKHFKFSDLSFKWRVFFKLCYYKQSLILSICIMLGEHLKEIMK